jgi:hypothetical protein
MTIEELLKPKDKKEPPKKANEELTWLDGLKILWFFFLVSLVCRGILYIWPT